MQVLAPRGCAESTYNKAAIPPSRGEEGERTPPRATDTQLHLDNHFETAAIRAKMYLSTATTAILTILSTFAAADFYVANTTTCMGTFIVQNCFHAAQVLSSGNNPNTTFGCNHLVSAEDNNHLNVTIGQTGALVAHSAGGICDEKNLVFTSTTKAGENATYAATDSTGKHVADCVRDPDQGFNGTMQHCNMWLGVMYFQTYMYCKSSVCG